MKAPRNMAASVRQRLTNRARERGETFDIVLTRYALERLASQPMRHISMLPP